jgi:two-component system, chemotaxis family, chemotaxis protein CheY
MDPPMSEFADMHGNMNTNRMKLPPVLDLAAAEGFLTAVREQLGSSGRLKLDAAAVETLTLPCIQVILAAQQSNGGVSVENPSTAFVSAFEDLGLDWNALCTMDELEPEEQSAESVAAAAEGASAEPESAPAPVEDQAAAKRILTIDDSKTIRDMLMMTLAEAGFDVLQAVDGQDGLDMLDKERVDVVITDINMPRMDGYEVIRQMRANAAFKSMPVLVLTTESEAEKRNLARAAGATGWMVKPFDPERLIATINKVAP